MLKQLKKSAPVRKGKALFLQLPRAYTRARSTPQHFIDAPPVVVNSLPKSGTHLLMQIADALPGTRNYGSFLAQTPSMSTKGRSQAAINQRLSRLVPGEVMGAHLHYSDGTVKALTEKNAVHLYIWRDPRDVLLSEAHYIAEMSRWHAMHKTFAALPDVESRVKLAIMGGKDGVYPPASERFGAYMGWRSCDNCLSVKYEHLVSPATQSRELARITEFYNRKATGAEAVDRVTLASAIRPENSHTFNKGGVARWKTEMSKDNLALCEERLGQWLSP